MYIIGIDLGGTKIEAILVKNDILQPIKKKRIPTESEQGYDAILQKIVKLVLGWSAEINEDFAVGIGIPGVLDPITKTTIRTNIKGFLGKSIQKDLAKILKIPVFVENDANCFALSEAVFGAAQGAEFVLGIIMGTGMGGGLVYQKKIISGYKGYAGEIGHVSFDANGEKCWCGNFGCAETYLSGAGIENRFQQKYKKKKSVQEIYELYLAQEPDALKFMNDFLDRFGMVIANLIHIISPHKIVLGGGVSNLPLLYKEGVERVATNLTSFFELPEIVPIPVPIIMPKTNSAPCAAPKTASLKAKQLASFSTKTGIFKILAKSFWIDFPRNPFILVRIVVFVIGSSTPGMPIPTAKSSLISALHPNTNFTIFCRIAS